MRTVGRKYTGLPALRTTLWKTRRAKQIALRPLTTHDVALPERNCEALGVLKLYEKPASGNCMKARILLRQRRIES